MPSKLPFEQRLHEYLIDHRACASCITCFHFNEETEVCALAVQRPPAKVLVVGCQNWDGAPF